MASVFPQSFVDTRNSVSRPAPAMPDSHMVESGTYTVVEKRSPSAAQRARTSTFSELTPTPGPSQAERSSVRPYKPGPAAKVFAAMVKASLAGESSDVRTILQPPDYRVEIWPNIGQMPVVNVRSKWLKGKIKAFTSAFRLVLKLPRNEQRWQACGPIGRVARELYGELISDAMEPRSSDLSDARLYEQVVVAGFNDLKANADGTHSLDLRFLSDYPVRDGFCPYGGELFVSFAEKAVRHIVTPEGRTVRPTDADWAFEAFRFRSSLFSYLTFVPHSVWCHGMVSPKLFIATHQLPEKHPLRILLTPFVHDVHKNVSRAKITVFGETGVLTQASSFTEASVQLLIAHGQSMMSVKLLDELALPDDLRAQIAPIWNAIRDCATQFIEGFDIQDDDPAVVQWKRFVALNINSRLGTLPLADAITYLVFTSTVSHHFWGHLYYGTTDPEYVSCSAKPVAKGASLCTAAEPADVTMMRMGVIVSVRRKCIKLSSDLSCTTPDPKAQRIFSAFSKRMVELETHNNQHQFERVACSGML